MNINEIRESYLTVQQLAEILNISSRHITYLCNKNRFPGAGKIGDIWLIPRESVENYERGKPGPRGNEELKKENERLRELLKEAGIYDK